MITDILGLDNWSVIKDEDESLYERYFRSSTRKHSYEDNWAFIKQETRNGAYKYTDTDLLLTVVSKSPESPYIFVFPPLGDYDVFVDRHREILRQLAFHSGKQVVLRKVLEAQADMLVQISCFERIDVHAFTHSRDIPEDVYPQVIINILDSVSCQGSQFAKMRNNVKFFKDNFCPLCVDLDGSNAGDVPALVGSWVRLFNRRHQNSRSDSIDDIIDQSAYTCLSEDFGCRIDNDHFFAQLLYAENQPIGFTLAGRTSPTDAALYSSICSTQYRGASEYLLLMLMRQLADKDVHFLNMGGAETKNLFDFKRKFAVHELRETWDLAYCGS